MSGEWNYFHRISCRHCGKVQDHDAGSRPDLEGSKRVARKQGWRPIRGLWYCPACVAEARAKGGQP